MSFISSPMTSGNTTLNRRKENLRVIFSVSIIVVGITHSIKPEQYARIVPPQLPYPFEPVYLSRFFEILGYTRKPEEQPGTKRVKAHTEALLDR